MAPQAIALAALLLRAAAAPAAPVVYTIDAAHTQVHWEARHFGTSTQRGRFAQIEGHIAIDRDSGDGEVSISIATVSVSSGVAALGSSFGLPFVGDRVRLLIAVEGVRQ